MVKLFSSIRAFIVPSKLSQQSIDGYGRLIKKHDGTLTKHQKESTHLFTVLKSASRISRNIEVPQAAPVVHTQWITDCDSQNKLLPLKEYIVLDKRQPSSVSLTTSSSDILHKRFINASPEPLQFDDESFKGHEKEGVAAYSNMSRFEYSEFVNTKYACLRPTPLNPKYNRKLISFMLLLQRKRELDGEEARALSYQQVVAALKAYPKNIESVGEAKKIIGIGANTCKRIQEFLSSGTICEADELRYDEKFRTLSLFSKVFGAGESTVNAWWSMGFRTLQEVLDNAKLTATTRLGIKLLPDFIQQMSREDVEEIINIVTRETKLINSESTVIPVGGYRRGKLQNGDVDLIVTTSSAKSMSNHFDSLMHALQEEGYLRHKLWVSSSGSRRCFSKGLSSTNRSPVSNGLPACICAFLQPSTGILRQVDITIVSPQELPTATLGWTGSQYFERCIREYAKKEKSLLLNNQGLYLQEGKEFKKVPLESEEDIFKLLGIPYLEPEQRNC